MADHILKAHILSVGGPTGESSQPDTSDDYLGTPDDAIEPPLPLEALQELSATNDVRATCIEALAVNTVGLGWTLNVEKGAELDVSDPSKDITDATDQLESLAARDKRLSGATTLSTLLAAVRTDEEEVGQGYIEVSRDRRTGKISGLFHLPAVRMRRLSKRDGYKLLNSNGSLEKDTRFYNFGEKVLYDSQGRPQPKLAAGKRWATNEVIAFKLYTSETRDYGLPRDVAMVLEYAGDKLAKESNVSFFDSSGTPPTIVFVAGEQDKSGGTGVTFKVPQQTAERIAATLKSDAGHQHRVAIVPVPPGTKAEAIKLGEFSDRDVGFVAFRQDNARRTLSSFRLQPIFVPAVSDQGRYAAEVQRAITLEQTFDPEQKRYEGVITETVLRELGYGHLRLAFKRMAVEDDKTRRDSAEKMGEVSAITRREFREAHGYGPLPEAAKSDTDIEWEGETYGSAEPEQGQVPYGWNDRLINAGKPSGAENRNPVTDTRGLTAGIGARGDSARHQDFLEANNGHSTSGAQN